MNYKTYALFFLISMSGIYIIKASEQDGYANCKLTIEIPEAWHTIAIDPCVGSFTNNEGDKHSNSLKRCKDYAAIIALKKPHRDAPCEVYLQYSKWGCQESYQLTSLQRDKEEGTFSAVIRKRYYDHGAEKVICDAKMFLISGKLNEPVTFHINNIGIWLFQLFGYKDVIPKRKVYCTLIVNA